MSTIATARNGTSCATPTRAKSGHQLAVLQFAMTAWAMPRPIPPAHAASTDESRPISAAARPGTISRPNATGLRLTAGATSMVSSALITAPSVQPINARRLGDQRASATWNWLSEAPRSARPVRLQRNQAASASATTTVMAAAHKRSIGIDASRILAPPCGRNRSTGTAAVPNCSTISDWMTASRPVDATRFATVDAPRSGRKTNRYDAAPSSADMSSAITIAVAVVAGPPSDGVGMPGIGSTSRPSWRSTANVNAPHMPKPTCARLTTPVALNVVTTPTPTPA